MTPRFDDVASGAVTYISTLTDVTALIGAFPSNDQVVANRGIPWVFKDDILVRMEGTSQAAIVCRWGGPASGSARSLNTERYMRLLVDIYVDPLRDANRNIAESSGGTVLRGNQLFSVLNGHLHRRSPDRQVWGDLVTTSCDLLTEPSPWAKTPDGDMLLMTTATYFLTTYGWTDVAV